MPWSDGTALERLFTVVSRRGTTLKVRTTYSGGKRILKHDCGVKNEKKSPDLRLQGVGWTRLVAASPDMLWKRRWGGNGHLCFKPERLSRGAGQGDIYLGRKGWWFLLGKGIQQVADNVPLELQREARNRGIEMESDGTIVRKKNKVKSIGLEPC